CCPASPPPTVMPDHRACRRSCWTTGVEHPKPARSWAEGNRCLPSRSSSPERPLWTVPVLPVPSPARRVRRPARVLPGGRAGPPGTLARAMSESSPPATQARLSAAQRRALAELLRVFPVVDEIGTRYAAAGFELHLVGGSVRDALLGRLGDDLDFATNARPEDTVTLLRGWAEAIWETGREFGTIGGARGGLRLEITTYRA